MTEEKRPSQLTDAEIIEGVRTGRVGPDPDWPPSAWDPSFGPFPGGDTARYHTGRTVSERPAERGQVLMWPHVGLVAVCAFALVAVAVAFACAWGLK